jgi:3'-phosphoadenosine 5'-phosphosulfate sulfotransferase (PAPS reductase)/FAD synthetase
MNHVVALSGGKDSTAMALRLAEIEPRDYTYVCTPTGDEPPEMFEHWLRLGEILGKKIIPLIAGTLDELIEQQNAIPNFRQRWCTRMLKIEPFSKYLESLEKPVTSYIGLRIDEGEREGGDYNKVDGVKMDFPMRRWGWTLHDVRSYLSLRNVEIPKRSDCLKCFFQRIDEWYSFWEKHPDKWSEGERLEELTGHTFRTPGKDSWPTSMHDLRNVFEQGRIPKRARDGALQELKCRVCRL